jgi:hypothetical protein
VTDDDLDVVCYGRGYISPKRLYCEKGEHPESETHAALLYWGPYPAVEWTADEGHDPRSGEDAL